MENNNVRVFIRAADGFLFDMDHITVQEADELKEMAFSRGDKRFSIVGRNNWWQLTIQIDDLEYDEEYLVFFNKLRQLNGEGV